MAKVAQETIERIRRLKKERGYSNNRLGEMFGVTRATIARYLSGKPMKRPGTSSHGDSVIPEVVELIPPVPMIEGHTYVISSTDLRESEWRPVMVLEQKEANRFLFRSVKGNWQEMFTLPQLCLDCKVEMA